MKFSLAVFLVVITITNFPAQSISIGINAGAQADYFTEVSGHLDSALVGTGGNWYSNLEGAYHFQNRFSVYCELGIQVERVGFIEIIPGLGSPIYAKEYQTPVAAIGCAYHLPLGKSKFSLVFSAGMGIGYMKPTSMSDYYTADNTYTWYEPNGNTGIDTLHVVFDLRDLTEPVVNTQVRGALGIEYRNNHFFLKAFTETRVWLRDMAEAEYHIERMDTYYKWEMNYTANGHFTVRGGYLGIGIGTGWYFGSTGQEQTFE